MTLSLDAQQKEKLEETGVRERLAMAQKDLEQENERRQARKRLNDLEIEANETEVENLA